MSTVEKRLQELGLELPPTRNPIAEYVTAVRTGNLLYVAGHGPIKDGQRVFIGRLGSEYTVEEGQAAAQLVTLNLLRTVKDHIGDLDRVRRVVKINVYVNSAPDFTEQPKVADGASKLLVQAFGEKGRHARTAIGTSVLPFNIAVEVEGVFEIEADE